MANIWEKAISIFAGNLNLGRSYLFTTVRCKNWSRELEFWMLTSRVYFDVVLSYICNPSQNLVQKGNIVGLQYIYALKYRLTWRAFSQWKIKRRNGPSWRLKNYISSTLHIKKVHLRKRGRVARGGGTKGEHAPPPHCVLNGVIRGHFLGIKM